MSTVSLLESREQLYTKVINNNNNVKKPLIRAWIWHVTHPDTCQVWENTPGVGRPVAAIPSFQAAVDRPQDAATGTQHFSCRERRSNRASCISNKGTPPGQQCGPEVITHNLITTDGAQKGKLSQK